MSFEWPSISLKDAGIVLIDCDHKTPKEQPEGRPYVGIPQLQNGRIVVDSARQISEEDFDHWRRKARPTEDDVIMSRRCNPGESAYVPANLEIALGQNLVLLRSDRTLVYPPFLRWVTQGVDWINQVKKYINVGAVFDSLRCADIPKFEIRLPPWEKQKKIADILAGLDKKIELNHQTNQTLEQIAQAIFKSWFVDFEPTRAKIAARKNGEDPERAAMTAISGKHIEALAQLDEEQLEKLSETAALFPDALVDSEMGEVPEGWWVGAFQDCCLRVESGGTPKRSEEAYWGGEIKWLSSGEVRDVIILDTKERISDSGLRKSSAKLWPEGATVVAMYGATAGQVCLLADEMTANQACCALVPKRNYRAFMFLAARRSIEGLAGKASGSAQQNLNKSLVSGYPVLLPSVELLEIFEQTGMSTIQKWTQNIGENTNLASIRDKLLPKLLSGQIPVEGK